MRVNENNPKHYIADEGKVFRCKFHNAIMGTDLYLDKINMENGLVEDTIDNYEEIDEPEREEEMEKGE
jgi:hypothetical protein